MNRRNISILLLASAWFGWTQNAPLFGEGFSVAEKITDGARKYQIARLSNKIADFDTSGGLHVAYWSGEETLPTSPSNPAYVYYRTWSPEAGWSAQIHIDDSFGPGGHIGGRHPAIALAPDGGVWVVWHDHRHSTPGNWMDNTEIYADFKPKDGAFSDSDIRLTYTPPPAHFAGDNGFAPKPIVGADGRVRVVWYDFHFSAGSEAALHISDIFLKTSDPAGRFNDAETMTDMRLTRAEHAYTMPDAALDTSGTLHLIWVAGTGDSSDLYYARISENEPMTPEIVLASNVRAYYDPPHIVAGSNGDIWIAYADTTQYEKVRLLRKPAGSHLFDPPLSIAENPSVRQYQPDIKIDAAGNAHLVWVRRRSASDRDVVYAVYDPSAETLGEETVLSPYPGRWDRPALALRGDGAVAVLFEENASLFAGDLWFTARTPEPRATAVQPETWRLYP